MTSYDDWKMIGHEDYPGPEDMGYVKAEDLPNFEDTRDFLLGIQEAIYKTGDIEILEHCLEELCHQYQVEFKPKAPQVETKNKNRLMHWYLGYQRASLDQASGRL